MRLRKSALLALLFAAFLSCHLARPAHAQVAQEQVEAAYLAKFARYVSWPGRSGGEGGAMQLCIVGLDPFGQSIDRAASGERIGGRSLLVRRVSTARGATGCQIAFVQGEDEGETRSLLNGFDGHSVLTVTSSRAGSARGMIHFAVRDQRVRFYIDDWAASRRGLSISSRLLALALAVNRQS